MFRRNLFLSIGLLVAGAALATSTMSAQVCDASQLSGAYGVVAAQSGAISTSTPTGGATTPTTTPTTAGSYSDTPIGQLLAGLGGTGPFSVTGRLVFDGVSGISSTSASGGSTTAVGTYTVNPDCSVSITLDDPFGSNGSVTTNMTGVIANRGAEVDLGVSQTPTSTTPGSIIQSGPGVIVRLNRMFYSSGCGVNNLSGGYAFLLTGVATEPSATSDSASLSKSKSEAKKALAKMAVPMDAPGTTGATVTGALTILGSMRFDGAGGISPNPSSNQSPLAYLQGSGSYTVNPDCTGSLTLSGTTPVSANFVLVQPSTTNASATNSQPLPELYLSISNAMSVVSGYAQPQ